MRTARPGRRGRVLVSAPLFGDALDRLRAEHDVEVGPGPSGLGHAGLLARLGAAEAVITLPTDRVDAELLDAAPRLRIVANHAVGLDNIDLEACRARGVQVTGTPGVLDEATADLTMALLLDACRRVSEGDRLVRRGAWPGWAPGFLVGKRVHGGTLGIVGLGRIGRAVARRAAHGFGMRVLYHQRHRAPPEVERELSAAPRALHELLEASDVVSLHCPLTPETRGLLGRAELARMRPGAVLINAARGACVDEEALAEALRAGRLFAAGLDVYRDEPAVPPSLLELPNVVLSPHLGSADEDARTRMGAMCVDAVLRALAERHEGTHDP